MSSKSKNTPGAFGKKRTWKTKDVEEIVANPLYVGIGPFPKVIEEEIWISCAVQTIKDHGVKRFLSVMLQSLRKSFGDWEQR